MAIAIRQLALGDESALRELMDATVPGWAERHQPLESGPASFLADSDTFVVGAYDSEEPVGWAWGVGIRRPNGLRMTYLHQLDVAEDHRRRGIATKLVEASMDIARRQGSRQFWLSTGGQNEVAQALYERLGGDRKPLGDVNYWWELP